LSVWQVFLHNHVKAGQIGATPERRFSRSDATPIDGEIIFMPRHTENRQQIRFDPIWHGFWLIQSIYRSQDPELLKIEGNHV
jgi:hypothetical protein